MPLSRRDFLNTSALTSAAVLTTPLWAYAKVAAFEFEDATLAGLQEKMKTGALTARALTRAYLDRIESVDRSGPRLRSLLETNPEALALADSLDRERKAKGPRGPLHGIPVLLKDNIDTRDKLTTTAGSLALEGSVPSRDSFVAERLRAAGAILIGKANMSEWANIRSSKSSSGWSARGGQCLNPYVLDRNPCGSSSGSGTAAAANLVAVAIGTETDGSIVCPSNNCGLVGIKPTLGLVSRAGIIPIAHSQDTAGPMCRTVRDAAVVLSAIAGVDPRDAETQASAEHAHADYASFLDPNGLKGARIGVFRKTFGFHASVDRLMEDALAEMKRQGAVLVDPADIPHSGEYDDSELEVLLYELKADLNAYLASLGSGARVRTLADVIRFNEENKDREMPYFGQDLFLKAEEKGPLTDKAYLEALEKNRRLSRAEGIDAVMSAHTLDAIVAPTGGPAWTTDCVNGDHFGGGSSTPAAVAGYPSITVPAGAVFGLPVGISFIGRAWGEPVLLRLAYAYEQATRHRTPPRFLERVTAGRMRP
ncbi:MAG TPA: amidase, partial [Vicinamibacteria bacterium]|nr:amidase [Vicinamibacteria bacterium]